MKLIWSRLKNYKCPSCNSALKDIGHYHACTKVGCIFSIGKERFNEIVSSSYKPRKDDPIDNQEALNNMDRPIVSRVIDF